MLIGGSGMIIGSGLGGIISFTAETPPQEPYDPNQVEYIFWGGIESTQITIEFKWPVQIKDAGTRPYEDHLIMFGDNNNNIYFLTSPSISPDMPDVPHVMGELNGEPMPTDILVYCEYGDEFGQTDFVQSLNTQSHPFAQHQTLEVIV